MTTTTEPASSGANGSTGGKGDAKGPAGGAGNPKGPDGGDSTAPGSAGAKVTGTKPDPVAGGDKPPAGEDSETAADQAGQFGQGSSEHEELLRGEQSLGGDFVQGDQVLGSKLLFHLYGGERPVRSRLLSDEVTAPVRHAFVEPRGWDELRVRSARHCLLIVRAEPGSGRFAAALQLLMCLQHESFFELNAEVDLDRLNDTLVELPAPGSGAGPGFLLHEPVQETRLAARIVRGLESELRRTRATLVVTVGRDVPIEDDLLEYVLDLPPAPAPADILRAHLEWRMPDRVEQELLRDDVRQFLATVLTQATTCAESALLATIMWEELGGLAIDLDRVRMRHATRGQDGISNWFEGLPDLETRSTAIALAVFNGLPYEEIVRTARRLLLKMERRARPFPVSGPSTPVTTDSRWRDPFSVPLRARTTRLRAEVEDGRPEGQRRAPVLRLAYRDVDYPPRVLWLAWNEYEVQEVLLEWLLDVIDDRSSQDALYQAAAALGFLAKQSFPYLRRHLFDDWAQSEVALHRDVVAVALRVAARDPEVNPAVEQFTENLFRRTDDPRAQATAARIYGLGSRTSDAASAPVREIAVALARLDRLAVINEKDFDPDEGWEVRSAIANSLISLILDADSESVYVQVLQLLLRWDDDPKRRDLAYFAFVIIANGIVRTVRNQENDEAAVWPDLLRMADLDARVRAPLLLLWREALQVPFLHVVAARVLRDWAAQAERDLEIRAAFARFVRALGADGGRTAAVLLQYADDWSDDDQIEPLVIVPDTVRLVLRRPTDVTRPSG
jgi:hypothetical protein